MFILLNGCVTALWWRNIAGRDVLAVLNGMGLVWP
jgi:hypothetical protein